MALYVVRGQVREGTMLLAWLSPCFQSLPSLPTSGLCPFKCLFLGGWACVCSRTLWVSPTDSPVRLGISPTAATPTCFYSQGFKALVSRTGALDFVICLPSCSSQLICTQMWDILVFQPPPCHKSSPPLLSVGVNVSSLTLWLSDSHTV